MDRPQIPSSSHLSFSHSDILFYFVYAYDRKRLDQRRPHPSVTMAHTQTTASLMDSAVYNGRKMRKRSVGTVELQTPDGRRKTVDVGDWSAADRQLAEQFGYKPVRGVLEVVQMA